MIFTMRISVAGGAIAIAHGLCGVLARVAYSRYQILAMTKHQEDAHTPATQKAQDGRLERSRSTRQQIVAAMLELVRERADLPGPEDVAARAGVGRRTVFRHFEDMDSLYAEIGSNIARIVMPMATAAFQSRHWRDKLHEMIDRRARIFEEIMPYRLVSLLVQRQSDFVQARLAKSYQMETAALRAVLPAAVIADTVTLHALDLMLGFPSWRRLRQEQGLDVDDARAVLHAMMTRQLAALPDSLD